jgi:hypothetical protein
MKISEYRSLCETAFKNGRRVMGVGPAGIGKTEGAVEAARRLDMDFIGLCSALEDPSSIRGYPSRGENGEATHCLFDGIARAFKATKPTVLFFDDLGMASESTMRAIMRLVQFGEIDNRKLPDCVVIGAASNDVGQGAGITGMIDPLKSRFHAIVNVETNVDDVVLYGLSHGWPGDLLAYLKNDPEAVHDCKPTRDMQISGACPRGWGYVADWIKCGVDDNEVLRGCIGKGRADSYLAFRALINELPDVDGCILAPDSSPLPDNPSAKWLIAMALASKMTGRNFGNVRKYLDRMQQMFRAYSIRSAVMAEMERNKLGNLPKGYSMITSSGEFTAWSASKDGQETLAADR